MWSTRHLGAGPVLGPRLREAPAHILPVEPRLPYPRVDKLQTHIDQAAERLKRPWPMTAPPSSTQPTLQARKKAGSWLRRLRTMGWSIRDAAQYLGVSGSIHRVRRPRQSPPVGMRHCRYSPVHPPGREELRTARTASISPYVRWLLSVQSSRLAMKWWPSNPAALPMRISAPTSCRLRGQPTDQRSPAAGAGPRGRVEAEDLHGNRRS